MQPWHRCYHPGFLQPRFFGAVQGWSTSNGEVWDLGVPSDHATAATSRSQICRNCCWAASLSHVLGLLGFPINQERIVRAVHDGPLRDTPPGTVDTMLSLLSGGCIDDHGRWFEARAEAFDRDIGQLILRQELSAGRPVIIVTNDNPLGHAMVATHMRVFRTSPHPGFHVEEIGAVVVRDPADARRRALVKEEWERVYAIIKVGVRPLGYKPAIAPAMG